ncbi:uncharacterized protein LOC113359837 [Papaver somniferum]|uniref:uncharacterized protein LOC113359837 n=1 Tax=Papaver somniferum TaxID=3469 RepID=UPI000E6FF6C8|nr:uncharacterized protein LOC113359837 [Papaver somniferum]
MDLWHTGKDERENKMKMRVIKSEINSLWGKYLNKEIRIMGHNLLLVRLNNEAERDEVIVDGPWLIDGFKYLKLEHMNIAVKNEAIGFIGRKISTKPRNCRPRAGNTVKTRFEVDLNKSLHRGGWWKTANAEDVWIRYHWELRPKNICPKCFVIDHDNENCEYTSHLLYLDSLTTAEYETLLKEDSEANKEKEGSATACNMEEELIEEGNIEDSRNVKRMRNSNLNAEPSMNPHNIRIQPPARLFSDRIGLAGGLLLLWKEGFQCSVQDKSNNIINVLSSLHPAKQDVLISFMYGSTYSDIKKIQWDTMSSISDSIMQLWIVIGDLNIHLHTMESSSSVSQDDRFFQQKINECGLMDLGYIGRDFTWSSNNLGTGIRTSIIDMALGNQQWCNDFPNARLYHLVQAGSDHCPTFLHTDKVPKNLWIPFKFFAMWLKHAGFKNQLKITWNTNVRGSPGHMLNEKHISTRKRISYWNKIDFGDIDSNINALQDQLLRLQNEPISSSQHDCLSNTNKQLKCGLISKLNSTSRNMVHEDIFDIIPTVITNDLSEFFTRIPSVDDVFQDNVGNDVVQAVQSFFISGFMPREFNKTYLSLIPKNDNAKYPSDFRPIGLCNTIYKIISKILANRIKPYLKRIISPYQSAFVPGRAIQDNIIIVHEMVHTMKHKEGNNCSMALKLDLSKAFGRLEWPFILRMLKKLGFPGKFCQYIEQCISTTLISILLNGSPTSAYSPTRGLRKGDPLSSYLFIIAMDYLSRLLVNAASNQVISGVKAARNAPAITHLLFADDILIFTKADIHNVTGIFILLISLEIFQDTDKYLGVTLLIGRDKSKVFKHLIQSFNARLIPWKGKNMNYAARSTMVKHVFNDLATHQMSVFRVPKNTIAKLDTIQRQFWAKYSRNSSLVHLDKLKDESSWLWRSIYSGLEVVQKHTRWLVRCGSKINIWLDVWVTGLDSPPVPVVGISSLDNFSFVCDLFQPGTRQWDINIVNTLFSQDCANLILNLSVPNTGDDTLIWRPDRKGKFTVKNAYNTIVAGRSIPTDVWKNLWNFKVPHRVQIFIWKCLKQIVPVRTKIARYKHGIETHCSFCKNSEETTNHIFMDCSYSRAIWFSLNINIDAIRQSNADFEQWIIGWFHSEVSNVSALCLSNENLICRFMCVIWYIWKDRCYLVFQDKKPHLQATVTRVNWLFNQCSHLNVQHKYSIANELQIKNWRPPDKDFVHVLGEKGICCEDEVAEDYGAEYFECKALEFAVEWMEELRITKEIFEMDCENVVKSISENELHTDSIKL